MTIDTPVTLCLMSVSTKRSNEKFMRTEAVSVMLTSVTPVLSISQK